MILYPESFLTGAIFGIALCNLIVAGIALFMAYRGADAPARALSSRSSPPIAPRGELSEKSPAATVKLEPRSDSGGRGFHLIDI